MYIKTHKLSENSKLPERAHFDDSGADVFAVSETVLKAGKVTRVPLGIAVEIPQGYDGVIYCKSGLSSKGIFASNAPIDAGYRGEVHAILLNTTDEDIVVEEGSKVGQLVIRPIIYANFVEEFGETRGTGAFGSTGGVAVRTL